MKRREFVVTSGLLALSTQVSGFVDWLPSISTADDLPKVDPEIQRSFEELLEWMETNGWNELVTRASGLSLVSVKASPESLFEEFVCNYDAVIGCEDFAGRRLIQPGQPQLSLLYHLLACPTVKFISDKVEPSRYPSLKQLDDLENYIYSLLALDPAGIDPGKMVLAVFAYEYRTGCKTPHQRHADLVFARTGFSRIGSAPVAPYDTVNRCFSNKPERGDERNIAVTPARYGLFLSRVVDYHGNQTKDANDSVAAMPQAPFYINSDDDNQYQFLLPIKKLFRHDLTIVGFDLVFSESHTNEKLKRLVDAEYNLKLPNHIPFDTTLPPFVRISNSSTDATTGFSVNDRTLIALKPVGSSVLLAPVPGALVRRAMQNIDGVEHRVRVRIPAKEKKNLLQSTNRRYTSYKVIEKKSQNKDAVNLIQASLFYSNRAVTDYHVPRNAPMFVNIRERIEDDGGTTYLAPELEQLELEINRSYWAGLFEDGICDGCVSASLAQFLSKDTRECADEGDACIKSFACLFDCDGP